MNKATRAYIAYLQYLRSLTSKETKDYLRSKKICLYCHQHPVAQHRRGYCSDLCAERAKKFQDHLSYERRQESELRQGALRIKEEPKLKNAIDTHLRKDYTPYIDSKGIEKLR